MARKNLMNQKGQTAVEYIFLIAVMVSVITSIFAVIKKRYLGDISQCQNGASKTQLICKINGILSDSGQSSIGKKFQFYRFHK
jgi:hypothetical protein